MYVGRVLSEAADGRLNVMSCLLEGTRETSQGCVVKLDLSSVTDASIFPGQVGLFVWLTILFYLVECCVSRHLTVLQCVLSQACNIWKVVQMTAILPS